MESQKEQKAENKPPAELLSYEGAEKVYFDGTKTRLVQLRINGKMAWGEISGPSKYGRTIMDTLRNASPTSSVEAQTEPPAAITGPLSQSEVEKENDVEAKKVSSPPAYASLNNRWAKFVVEGQEYTRDEFLASKLDENLISEVCLPTACKKCGKPWRLKTISETLEPPQPISPESRGLRQGVDYDVTFYDPDPSPIQRMTGVEVDRCCDNPEFLHTSFLFEVEVKPSKVKKPKTAPKKKTMPIQPAPAQSTPEEAAQPAVAPAANPAPVEAEAKIPVPDFAKASQGEIDGYFQKINERNAGIAAKLSLPSQHGAATYMRELFQEEDLVCICLIHGTKTYTGKDGRQHPETKSYFQTLKDGTDEAAIRALTEMNKDWHIYVCMNSIKGEKDEKGRIIRSAGEVRTVYTEIDEDGDKAIENIKAAASTGEIPYPHYILQSSPHKFQVIWRARMTLPEQGALNKALQVRFKGDPQSVDSARVLRLPLFRNIKPAYGKDFESKPIVTIKKHEAPAYTLADFHIKIDVKEYVRGEAVADAVLANRIEKIENFLIKAGLGFKERNENRGYWKYEWIIPCPNAQKHTTAGDTASVSLAVDGTIGSKCYHAHCADHDWKWLKQWMEEKTGEKLIFNDPEPEKTKTGEARKTGPRKLSLVKASTLKPKHIRWFWENRILANKPNVFFGEPGVAKGFVGVDFIARMTTGRDFYDCFNNNEPCEAIICCSEDSREETILPRLIVAEANTDRIHFLDVEEEIAGSVEEGLMALDEDLPRMAEMLKEYPNVRIIYVDPLATYMGELDSNHDKEVRPVYTAMKTFTEKHNVCFFLIAHPNKNEEASAINRLSGAKALTSVFRNTWLVEKDPEDKTVRVMASVKGNLAGEEEKTSLRFRIENVADTGIIADDGETIKKIGRLVWLGKTDKDADELLQGAAAGGKNYARKKEQANALQLLKEYLANGAKKAEEFYEQAEVLNLSNWVVRKAKAILKLKHRRIHDATYWARTTEQLDAKQSELDRAQIVFLNGKPAGQL